ncbi:MAG: response regulator [Gammaproteobacteria bacterium]|nr:response regulator [Gammaproteobacteria bacterium]
MDSQANDILVVDDNDTILTLVTEVARNSGYSVRTARNAQEFFDAFDEHKPALMLVDIVMPDMDGLELIQKLSEISCKIPLVIMSGYNYVDDKGAKLLTKNLNFTRFLHKPFDVDELEQLFRDSLQAAH